MIVRVVTRPDEILSAGDLGLTEDDATEAAVQAAVQFLDGPYGYLGASLGVQTIEAAYCDWYEADSFMLPQGPVIEINSVKYLDVSGVEQTLDPTSYRMVGERIYWTATNQHATTLWTAGDAVRIEYEAGYSEDEVTGPLPAPIQQAIGIIAKQMTSTLDAVAGDSLKSIEVPGVLTKSYGSWASSAGGQSAIQNSIRSLVGGYIRRSQIA